MQLRDLKDVPHVLEVSVVLNYACSGGSGRIMPG